MDGIQFLLLSKIDNFHNFSIFFQLWRVTMKMFDLLFFCCCTFLILDKILYRKLKIAKDLNLYILR